MWRPRGVVTAGASARSARTIAQHFEPLPLAPPVHRGTPCSTEALAKRDLTVASR
jgi:hypothetical protein